MLIPLPEPVDNKIPSSTFKLKQFRQGIKIEKKAINLYDFTEGTDRMERALTVIILQNVIKVDETC